MRNPKSSVVALIVTVGLWAVAPFFALVGAVLFVWIVRDARQDARHRYSEEATVQRMAAHAEAVLAEAEGLRDQAEAVLAEAEELRDQAKADAAEAKAKKEETARQLAEFTRWQQRQMLPSPQELFDQHEDEFVRHKTDVLMSEIEEHLKDV